MAGVRAAGGTGPVCTGTRSQHTWSAHVVSSRLVVHRPEAGLKAPERPSRLRLCRCVGRVCIWRRPHRHSAWRSKAFAQCSSTWNGCAPLPYQPPWARPPSQFFAIPFHVAPMHTTYGTQLGTSPCTRPHSQPTQPSHVRCSAAGHALTRTPIHTHAGCARGRPGWGTPSAGTAAPADQFSACTLST